MTAALGAAAITGAATTVVPWVRDAFDRGRLKRESRMDRLADIIRGVTSAVMESAVSDRSLENVRTQTLNELQLMMELQLVADSGDAGVANTVMLGFTLVRADANAAPKVIGEFARLLPEWRRGEISADEVLHRFESHIEVPEEMLAQLHPNDAAKGEP